MNWYLKVLKNYATFSGRARRTEYWMFTLFSMIIAFILGVIDTVLFAGEMYPLQSIYFLAVLVPSLAVSVRRLHDTNRSGWWLLIGVIPLIGAVALLVFMALDEVSEGNNFGESPKLALHP